MKMKKNLIDYELLWEKITDYVKATSRTTARPVLLLYYVLRSPETPSSDKMLIVAALSYLVLPIDLISAKRLPIIGWGVRMGKWSILGMGFVDFRRGPC